MGDRIDTTALQALLNRYAQDLWHVKSIPSASVAGRIGGGMSGLVIVFERRVVH